MALEWQRSLNDCLMAGAQGFYNIFVIQCHSALCKSAHAIQGESPHVIYCHKIANGQWLMAKSPESYFRELQNCAKKIEAISGS